MTASRTSFLALGGRLSHGLDLERLKVLAARAEEGMVAPVNSCVRITSTTSPKHYYPLPTRKHFRGGTTVFADCYGCGNPVRVRKSEVPQTPLCMRCRRAKLFTSSGAGNAGVI